MHRTQGIVHGGKDQMHLQKMLEHHDIEHSAFPCTKKNITKMRKKSILSICETNKL